MTKIIKVVMPNQFEMGYTFSPEEIQEATLPVTVH